MDGYEFLDDEKFVVKPLNVIATDLLCFGYVRSVLPKIQVNNIANIVIRYAFDQSFYVFNEKVCSVTRSSSGGEDFIRCCGIKKKSESNVETNNSFGKYNIRLVSSRRWSVIFVPFISTLIKNAYENAKRSKNIAILKPRSQEQAKANNNINNNINTNTTDSQLTFSFILHHFDRHKIITNDFNIGLIGFGKNTLNSSINMKNNKIVDVIKEQFRIKMDKYLVQLQQENLMIVMINVI